MLAVLSSSNSVGFDFSAAALENSATGVSISSRDIKWPSWYRRPPNSVSGKGYEKAIGVAREDSLNTLLEEADVSSLHVPLTKQTHHMIDVPQLRRMKKTAFRVNTARGPIIRHALENEPEGVDLFRRFKNCILTPHTGFYSQESIAEMRRSSATIVRDALLSRKFSNIVNGVPSPLCSDQSTSMSEPGIAW
jgi:D-isomer specific 2-hydroxyacid dehydrogenase-like protein